MSHRHLLCKRRYNCGATDHLNRHLLCKHRYNCGGTDHSHRPPPNTNIIAAPLLNLTRFRDHSRRTRHCGEPYGGHTNGCRRLPTVAVANVTFGEHSPTPRPPSETGTLATHSGKNTTQEAVVHWCFSLKHPRCHTAMQHVAFWPSTKTLLHSVAHWWWDSGNTKSWFLVYGWTCHIHMQSYAYTVYIFTIVCSM